MGRVHRAVYVPSAGDADRYDELFTEYTALSDHFGRGGSDVMHTLKRIRREAAAVVAG